MNKSSGDPFLAPWPRQAGMHLLDEVAEPGRLSTLITHPLGASWPDRRGVALVGETLELGSLAIVEFSSLCDALTAYRRLTRELAY